MKNWKDECNYRRIKDKDGVVIANVIYIDGEAIQVTNEVYEAYAQMGRRERYLEEQMNETPHVSLEKLMEADVPIDIYTNRHIPSSEKIILEAENEMERAVFLLRLPEAIMQLTEKERGLIHALYYDCIPAREYARQTGVCEKAIRKRRNRILKKMMNFFQNQGPHPPVFSAME